MVSKERQYDRLERNGWSPSQTHLTEFAKDRPLYPGQKWGSDGGGR